MKNLIYIFILIVFVTSCEETIVLDTQQAEPIYVVEGLVTNEMKQHYVKLTKSVGFYEEVVAPPPVTNANITVTDDQGNIYAYQYNSEDSTYYSSVEFQGIEHAIYSLEINVEGDRITALDTLKPISPINAVLWRVDENEKKNPEKEGYFYEITLTAKEPKETVDFYLFQFYRNDSIQRFDSRTGVFFADDIFVQEDIDNFPAPVFYKENDTARFEMLSLTKLSYKYYNDLSFLLNNDGGMFSSIPANPYTNLRGTRSTGYFQVSAIDSKTIIVGDPEFENNN